MTWRFGGGVQGGCPVRIVFASDRHFAAAADLTRRLLPGDEVSCSSSSSSLEKAHVVVPLMERIGDAELARSPDLRLVMQFGVGLEGVDIAACTRRGIAVSNIPAEASGNATATAEHALFLCLALLRGGIAELRSRFEAKVLGGPTVTRQAKSKTALVVGFGAVGKEVARLLDAIRVRVLAAHGHRKWRDDEETKFTCDLEDALPRADIVVLCCPLTEETRGLVGSAFCQTLKPGALLVNVGRGPLVDRQAVLEALDANRLAGFATDVGVGGVGEPSSSSEPWDPNDALATHPRAYFTPHVGGYSDEAYAHMAEALAAAVHRIRRGDPPAVWINNTHQ